MKTKRICHLKEENNGFGSKEKIHILRRTLVLSSSSDFDPSIDRVLHLTKRLIRGIFLPVCPLSSLPVCQLVQFQLVSSWRKWTNRTAIYCSHQIMSIETNKAAKATHNRKETFPLPLGRVLRGNCWLHHNCVTIWNLQRERENRTTRLRNKTGQ